MEDAEVRKQTSRDLMPKWKWVLKKENPKGNLEANVKSFAINGGQSNLTVQYLLWMVTLWLLMLCLSLKCLNFT